MDLLRQTQGSPGYSRSLQLLARHIRGNGCDSLPAGELGRLLQEQGIRSLLEIGPGNGAFLRSFAPVLRRAGVESYAVGLTLDPFTQHLLAGEGVHALREDALDLGRCWGSYRFDLILAVGVLSLATVVAGKPVAGNSDRVQAAAAIHLRLLQVGLERLSSHPCACFLASSPVSFLILKRADVEAQARVLVWEIEEAKRAPRWFQLQRRRFSKAYSLTPRECRSYEELWRAGADGAVLTR